MSEGTKKGTELSKEAQFVQLAIETFRDDLFACGEIKGSDGKPCDPNDLWQAVCSFMWGEGGYMTITRKGNDHIPNVREKATQLADSYKNLSQADKDILRDWVNDFTQSFPAQ